MDKRLKKRIGMFLFVALIVGIFSFVFVSSALWDASGTYDISSFSTWGFGIANDGTYFYMADLTEDLVKVIWLNGTFYKSYTANSALKGIHVEGDFIYTSDESVNNIYKSFKLNGTAVSNWASPTSVTIRGMCGDSTGLYLVDDGLDKIYKTTYAGADITNWALSGTNMGGCHSNETFIWVVDVGNTEVDQHFVNGTYMNNNFDMTLNNANSYGITCDNGAFCYLPDGTDDLIYKYEAWGVPVTITVTALISSPDNNTILTNKNFTTTYNITSDTNTTFYNSTLNVYNSANSVLWTKTNIYGDNRSNFSDSLSITTTATGKYSYDVVTYYNDTSDGNKVKSVTTAKNFFTNGAIFNIVDDDGNFVTDAITEVEQTVYNSNPFGYPASLMSNPNNETLNITSYSNGGFYISNVSLINMNLSANHEYNISLESYKLSLIFTQEGSAFNVSGYITDNITSFTFQNESFLKQQVGFSGTIVQARFINAIYNLSAGMTWENKSQFYEYDNSIPYAISETIEIFKTVDTSSYFQTQDNAGNIIQSAKIRIYGTIPSNISGANSSYSLYGQRITDNTGTTVFPLDSEMELFLTITATGYKTKTVRLTASEITTFTADDPFIVRLEKSSYVVKDNVFVGDLWKINGSKVTQSYFNDLSSDYFLMIYDYYGRSLKYQTSYEGINRTISLDSTIGLGIIELSSGEQFSSSNNATWYIYIYVDEKLTYTIGMIFNSETQEVILNVEDLGLDDNSAWKTVIFLGLIMISSLMGLIFRTPEGDAGVNTFFVGGFISSVAVVGLGWLSIIGTFHYLGKLVKKWVSE